MAAPEEFLRDLTSKPAPKPPDIDMGENVVAPQNDLATGGEISMGDGETPSQVASQQIVVIDSELAEQVVHSDFHLSK